MKKENTCSLYTFFSTKHFTLVLQNIILKAVQHSMTLIYHFCHFSTMGT